MKEKYKLVYTLLVVFMNETALALYNAILKTDAFLHDAINSALVEIIPAFIVGVIIEYLIVSRVMEFIADELKHRGLVDKNHKYIDEILLSLGMVLVVTSYGLLVHGGIEKIGLKLFVDNLLINIVFAIPFFILFIHPVTIKLMNKIFKEE